jgi:hypothetical protein
MEKFNQNLCSLFDVEYTPEEMYRIPVENKQFYNASKMRIEIGVAMKDP